jgi:CDP-diacylglycerol--serine O-phosphatidyltransferase
VLIVLFFALLISYPWAVLTIGTVLYLATLPFGWLSYRNTLRKTAVAGATAGAAANEAAGVAATPAGEGASQPSPPLAAEHPPQPERPTRLN